MRMWSVQLMVYVAVGLALRTDWHCGHRRPRLRAGVTGGKQVGMLPPRAFVQGRLLGLRDTFTRRHSCHERMYTVVVEL